MPPLSSVSLPPAACVRPGRPDHRRCSMPCLGANAGSVHGARRCVLLPLGSLRPARCAGPAAGRGLANGRIVRHRRAPPDPHPFAGIRWVGLAVGCRSGRQRCALWSKSKSVGLPVLILESLLPVSAPSSHALPNARGSHGFVSRARFEDDRKWTPKFPSGRAQ
jgi:hypothetical protein